MIPALGRESCKVAQTTMDTPRGPILAKMFDEMDANGDGQIDEKEGVKIGRLLAGGDATMGKQFWAELKAGADDDGDGRISKEEYVRYGRSVTDAKAAHVLQLHLARLEEANARQARQSHRKLDPRAQATRVFRFLDTDGGTCRSVASPNADMHSPRRRHAYRSQIPR